MQIKGRFSKKGEPFIDVGVSIPSHKTRKRILFLIDTGATHSSINLKDAHSLGIDIEKLPKHSVNVRGVGGEVPTYVLKDVYLIFETEKDNYVYFLDEMYLNKANTPSILGMDFINKFRLILSWEEDIIIMTDQKIRELCSFKK